MFWLRWALFSKSVLRRYIFLLLAGMLIGCSHLASVTQTNIPDYRKKKVTAHVEKLIFLGFNFSNDHALTLESKLRRKCPNGDVKGILTKDARTMYLLFFLWSHDIEATGYCVPTSKKASSATLQGVGESDLTVTKGFVGRRHATAG